MRKIIWRDGHHYTKTPYIQGRLWSVARKRRYESVADILTRKGYAEVYNDEVFPLYAIKKEEEYHV